MSWRGGWPPVPRSPVTQGTEPGVMEAAGPGDLTAALRLALPGPFLCLGFISIRCDPSPAHTLHHRISLGLGRGGRKPRASKCPVSHASCFYWKTYQSPRENPEGRRSALQDGGERRF